MTVPAMSPSLHSCGVALVIASARDEIDAYLEAIDLDLEEKRPARRVSGVANRLFRAADAGGVCKSRCGGEYRLQQLFDVAEPVRQPH